MLLLFPAMCWVALRLLRFIHINEGFPDKNQKWSRSAALVEKHTHTLGVKQIWRSLNRTYSSWRWCFRRQWKLVMPQCQHWSWSAQYYHIYTHPVAGIQVGQDDSRGTGDGGYLAQWRMGVSHGVKAKLEFTVIVNDETVMSDRGLVRVLIRDSCPPLSGQSHNNKHHCSQHRSNGTSVQMYNVQKDS